MSELAQAAAGPRTGPEHHAAQVQDWRARFQAGLAANSAEEFCYHLRWASRPGEYARAHAAEMAARAAGAEAGS